MIKKLARLRMKRLIFCHVKLHVLVIKVRDELNPRPAPALLCGEDSTIDTVNSLMPKFFCRGHSS